MKVALDVGGSSIKSGLVAAGAVVDEIAITPLDNNAPADVLIQRFIDAIGAHPPTSHVALACPAPFDYPRGISLMQHKFTALYGTSLASLIAEALDRPVEVGCCNDAAAAVVGEALAGAGRGHRRVLGITLGTGLGAALAADGNEVESCGGIVIGNLYTLPVDAERIADDVFSARTLMQRVAEHPRADIDVLMSEYGTEMGTFLTPVVNAVAADVLVVGGGGIASFDRFGPALRAALPIPVEVARLDRAAPLIGAAHLCFPR